MLALKPGRGSAAVVLFGAVVWLALDMHQGVMLSSDIKSQYYPWRGVTGALRPQTTWDSDPVWQFVPWLELARAELAAGRLPLWNPYQDGGVPLLGNAISALGSPMIWPALAVGAARGWNLSLLLRILVAGSSTFLFLRERGRSTLAAGLGALAFSLSGPFVAWLEHPHTLVAAALPALLLFISREAGGSTTSRSGIALSTAVILLGGHPETALMAAMVAGTYALTFGAARAMRTVPPALLGAGLAAPFLLTFLDYYASSVVRGGSTRGAIVLPVSDLARLVLVDVPGSHKVEAAATVSLAVLALSTIAVFLQRRDREMRYWACVAVACLAVSYRTPVAEFVASRSPVYWSRALLLLPLALGALAALGLDTLRERARSRGRARPAALVAALLTASSFGELLLAARGFHGVTSPMLLSTDTPLLARLRADRDLFRILPLHDVLPANSATDFRLEDVRGYDAIGPLGWRTQRGAIGHFAGLPTTADALEPWNLAPGRALDFWNVKYLVSPPWDRLQAQALNQAFGLDLEEVYYGPDGKLFRNRRVLPRVRLSGPGTVQMTGRTPTRWTLRAAVPLASALVIANPRFPGWRVEVDGKRQHDDGAPGSPYVVRLKPGEHTVTLTYSPPLLLAGCAIALGSAALLVLAARRGSS